MATKPQPAAKLGLGIGQANSGVHERLKLLSVAERTRFRQSKSKGVMKFSIKALKWPQRAISSLG